NQDFTGTVEVLVLDSGSSDGTLAIVAQHPVVRLHQIPNSEFGHGRTRNLAASLARGAIVAYLTHDAVPADEHWLSELVAPFALFPGVEGVLGRQIGRPGCVPILKYEIRRVFSTQGPEFGTTLSYRTAAFDRVPHYWLPAAFYSDVNSAAHRDFLLNTMPYRDVDYAEDQLFGRDLLDAGYVKAYAARGAVEHSNDLTYAEYKKRTFDEIVGLRASGATVPSAPSALRRLVRALILDPADILRDRDYSARRKLYWLIVNPFYHLAKSSASRRARRIRLDDRDGIAKGSLERERRAT
ncbi:MAG TPA: glycosyltransferase family 2 protein, partial [Galbitalea sp.]